MTIFVFGLLFLMQEQTVEAAKPKFQEEKVTLFVAKEKTYIPVFKLKNVSSGAQIINVKCSNSKVLKKYGLYKKNQGIYCKVLKKGSCTITCKIKQGDKQYTIKCKVTVNEADPFKTIEIEGKNIYDKGKDNLKVYFTKAEKVKIKYNLKKGWKLKRMYYNYHTKFGKTYKISDKMNTKNNKKVPVRSNGYTSVKICVENSKKQVYQYMILLYPDTTD